MKTSLNWLFLLSLLLVFNCSNDETSNTPENPDPVDPILSENIDVYTPNLFDNSLVLAIENGANTSYIINKEGEKLFTWNFDRNLGNDLELLDDGTVLGMFKSDNPSILFGGWAGMVRLIEPNGNIAWEFELNTNNEILHHDAERLPNGNILLVIWERIDALTLEQYGGDYSSDIFTEKIIEINPNTNDIVWQWRSIEHTIQDFNSSATNFGDISQNPNRIDINYNSNLLDGDIMHSNGFDYDVEKDIIYLSINFYNEVWVIDHSTTTEEASGTSGGNYDKGGDLIYRFGNPLTYQNTEGNVLFDRNHFPNILDNNEIGAGNVLIYVNGNSISQSTVYELDIPNDFSLTPDTNNEPSVIWSFTDENLFSNKISGAVRLKNGNTLICEGDFGYWEVTEAGEVAWKYNGLGTSFWRGYAYNLDAPGLSQLGISF